MESWVRSWRPRTNAFCDFSSPCLWSQAPTTKKWSQAIRSAAPVTQKHLPKTEDLMLQNATFLRKSAPWPNDHVSYTAPATENASFQIFFKCPTPAIVLGNARKLSRVAHLWQGAQFPAPATWNDIRTSKKCSVPVRILHFWLGNVLRASSRHSHLHFLNISTSKVLWMWCALYILTSKCSSGHNRVHFLNISTSKSALNVVCFVHLDFEMSFAPPRRPLFRHHNFQKWSGVGVLCTFWLRDVLRPQRRSLFRHLNFQKRSEHGVLCTFWSHMCFTPQRRATFHLSSGDMAPHPPF